MNTTAPNMESNGVPWNFWLEVVHTVIMVYLSSCQLIVAVQKSPGVRFFGPSGLEITRAKNVPFLMSLSMAIFGALGIIGAILGDISYHIRLSPPVYGFQYLTGIMGFFGLYFVLWLRQATFQRDPAMKHLSNKILRGLSNFEGGFICLSGIIFPAMMVYQIVSLDCSHGACLPGWLTIVIIVAQFKIQLVLLLLFVHPLLKHRQNLRRGSASVDQTALVKVVKRAVAVTSTSILIDLSCLTIFLLTIFEPILSSMHVLNYIVIFFCFPDWRTKFLPCYSTSKSQNQPDPESGRSTSELQISSR